MPRRIVIDPSLRNLDDWPPVAFTTLPERRRNEYLRRELALRRWLSGDPLTEIEAQSGLQRQQIYNLLRRCLSKHPDGRIYGFRGLLPYEHVKRYVRTEPVPPGEERKTAGAAGAMRQLIERYPALLETVTRCIRAGEVVLTRAGHVSGLRELHRVFIKQCEALGIAAHRYPLNQVQKGKRALSELVKALINESFTRAAHASSANRVAPPWEFLSETSGVSPPTIAPLEVVEFDGHKLDVRLRVRLVDPYGLTYDLELQRVWLLVILDVASRAVLGWNVVLSSEYDRHDVIRTMQIALQPRRRRIEFSIPRLSYEISAGFHSQAAPCYEYATWRWLRVDNARANLAVDTLTALTQYIGCSLDAGPVGHPNERPYIERFFGTIGQHLSHRLPGTTGHQPADIRRALSDPRGNAELLVTFEELEELLDVTIANYNGTPHSALAGRSPLAFLSEYAVRSAHSVRCLSEFQRRHVYMIQPPHQCEVRGNRSTGRRPHINFFGARYSGPVLTNAAALVGVKLLIYFDPSDLRTVQAFLPSGAELGALQANAPWHQTAHSLRLRREILRLRRRNELNYGEADDPVALFLEHKRRQSRSKLRRKGHRLAEAQQALSKSGNATAPSGDETPTPSRPVKPRRLSIGDKAQTST